MVIRSGCARIAIVIIERASVISDRPSPEENGLSFGGSFKKKNYKKKKSFRRKSRRTGTTDPPSPSQECRTGRGPSSIRSAQLPERALHERVCRTGPGRQGLVDRRFRFVRRPTAERSCGRNGWQTPIVFAFGA